MSAEIKINTSTEDFFSFRALAWKCNHAGGGLGSQK